ncbi:hypothetical protein [Acinetobacter sp. ANC 3832]|nr:hypothetical protein [Acinetobacter sp. ANC 3832]
MDFSLMFMRTENNDIADADHEGIQQFLNKKGLHIQEQSHSGGLD